jgi:hypothetical protein
MPISGRLLSLDPIRWAKAGLMRNTCGGISLMKLEAKEIHSLLVGKLKGLAHEKLC